MEDDKYPIPGCAPLSTIDKRLRYEEDSEAQRRQDAADMYVTYLTDEDLKALDARNIDRMTLKNKDYQKLFSHGNGSYFVAVDFGAATFNAILLTDRAQKRITRVMAWHSLLDSFLEFLGRVWRAFRGRS